MQLRLGAPDRRKMTRGTTTAEPNRGPLVMMILGSYREMPGLCLRPEQAARLFAVRPQACEVVLDDLVGEGKLTRDWQGQYMTPGSVWSDGRRRT
jgi:hypothetical protein